MSLKNRTTSTETDSRPVSSVKLISDLLSRHYQTWSRLYVEQRIRMFESGDD